MIQHAWRTLLALILLSAAGAGAWQYLTQRRSAFATLPQSANAPTPPGPALRQYLLPFTPDSLYPSPLGDGGIWLSSHGMVQAFDPSRGKCYELNDRFGDFAYVMGKAVAADPFEPDKVWIGSPNRGLLCYLKGQGRSELAAKPDRVGSVVALVPDASGLWIASRGGLSRHSPVDGKVEPVPVGLYRRARSDGTLELVHAAPQGVDEIRMDTNLGVCFRVGASWWAIAEGGEARPIPPLPDTADRLKAILYQFHPEPTLRPDRVGQVAEDGDAIWFLNLRGLGRMDRKTGSYGYVKLLCGRATAFLVAPQCIWVCCGDQLFAIDKYPPAHLLQSEIDLKAADQESQELFRQTSEATDIVSMLDGMTRILANLDARYANAPAKQKEESTRGTIREVDGWLRAHPHAKLAPLQALQPQEQGIPPSLYLYTLMCGYALKGNAEAALRTYARLGKTEGSERFLALITPEDVRSMRVASEGLKRTQTTEMPPDQRLWELAQAYSNLEATSWNRLEVGFDRARSRQHYQKLLKQHPASRFADSAWWELERLEFRWSNEGCYDPRDLTSIEAAYLDFLTRYPDSGKAPLARFLLASMVHFANEPTNLKAFPVNQRRAWLLKARTWCQEAAEAEQRGQEVRSPTIDLTPKALLPRLEADLMRYPATGARKPQ